MTDWKVGVFLVCAVIVAATGVAGLLALEDGFAEPLNYEPDTRKFVNNNWEGYGQFPKTETSSYTELLDSPIYTMSFTDDGDSQKIIVALHFNREPKALAADFTNWNQWRFCFAIKTNEGVKAQRDGLPSNDMGTSDIDAGDTTEKGVWYNAYAFKAIRPKLSANGCWTFPDKEYSGITTTGTNANPKVFYIEGAGIPHGSVIKVQAQNYGRPHVLASETWRKITQDESLLFTGLGYLSADKEVGYEIGDTAVVTVSIPYLESVSQTGDVTNGEGGFGFYFRAYHADTGNALKDESGITLSQVTLKSLVTVFRIPVLTEHFSMDMTKDNLLHFELYNELYPKDATDRVVVDVREKAPPPPNVGTDKVEYEQGDTVNVEWACFPNEKTNLSIVKTLVIAYINGIEVHKEEYSLSEGIASFTAPIAGILKYNVICYDSENRGSGNEEKVVIHNQEENDYCTANPTHPLCVPSEPGFPIWEVLILLLAFIGMFFVVAIVAYLLNAFGLPTQYVIIIAIALFLLLTAAILMVGQGAIDTIANYQAG
ncbi:MAG: hypothetical protein ACW99U_18560 [Candidatus Thorarchaeota archaeon]|jgi:hypothetical protein